MNHAKADIKRILFPLTAVIVAVGLGIGGYGFYSLYEGKSELEERVVMLSENIMRLEAGLDLAMFENDQLAEKFAAEENKSANLGTALEFEQNKNQIFNAQIRDLSITVSSLQKLSETDKELLQKYSRVYFLSDNYVPENLSAILAKYLQDENKTYLIHSGVSGYLQGMLNVALQEGIELKIVSAYRSFAEQAAVKSSHLVTYGSGANKFSAEQGYSEHQLGTTVDFITDGVGGLSTDFEKSGAYKWLVGNAYKFGFVLSYPKDNIYYQFEPWHWRFVGTRLATKLYNENKYFYELSQRDIDDYLIAIFD